MAGSIYQPAPLTSLFQPLWTRPKLFISWTIQVSWTVEVSSPPTTVMSVAGIFSSPKNHLHLGPPVVRVL